MDWLRYNIFHTHVFLHVLTFLFLSNVIFITEDNSNAPERMASVQGTPEQVQHVQKLIQEIIEQVISLYSFPFLFTEVCPFSL